MALLPVSTDYTDKDFDSVKRRLSSVIQSVFPTWTDTSVSNFGNILLEAFCFCLDGLAFYQDNQAIESRITTATQRKNLLALVKLINYEPATAKAAQVLQRFTADPAPAPGDSIILGGTGPSAKNPLPIVVKTGDADEAKFELQETVTLTNAAPTAWGLVENSETHLETFQSTGFIGQEIRLSHRPYLDGTAVIVAVNGEYTEVQNFLESSATDLHFTVHVDNTDTAIIRFGDQVSGQLPTGDIIVYYKTGGGTKGNVEPDSITVIEGSFQTEASQIARIKTLNFGERAKGGADRETEAQIKEKAPESLRVLTRAVSREDFEILARRFGMARALLLTAPEDGDVPLNTGHFHMIPPTTYRDPPTFPTAAQMDEVLRLIRRDYPYASTFVVHTKFPVYLDVKIRAKVYLRKGYSHAEARQEVLDAFADYFSLTKEDGSTNDRVNFGFYFETGAADGAKVLPLSDLVNTLRDCESIHRLGVYEADFTVGVTADNNTGIYPVRVTAGSHTNIPINRYEFPRFNRHDVSYLTLVDGATGVEF